MSTSALEKLIWVLIYGGLLGVCLGLFVKLQDVRFGWRIILGSLAVTALGVLLIVVRSRREP